MVNQLRTNFIEYKQKIFVHFSTLKNYEELEEKVLIFENQQSLSIVSIAKQS